MGTSNRYWLISWLVLTLAVFVACGTQSKSDRYLIVDDIDVNEAEMMLYLHQTFFEFEALGGSDVWNISDFSGGKSASDVAKQGAIDNIIMTKVLVKKAAELGVLLTEENKQKVEEQAKTYLENLSTSFVEKYNITEEVVRHVLEENYLAKQVELNTKGNYEVTREELGAKLIENQEYNDIKRRREDGVELMLTVYEVEHIVAYTHKKNSTGQWVVIEPEADALAQAKINEAKESINGGMSFLEAVSIYSDADNLTDTTSKVTLLQLSEPVAKALSMVEMDGVSDIIKGDYGYHLFKVINKTPPTTDEVNSFNQSYAQWEEALFEEAKALIIDEGFRSIYDQWRSGVDIVIEENLSNLDLYEVITGNKLIEK